MTGSPEFEDPGVRHYVFIDDFCGSGTQAKQYSSKVVDAIHDAAGTASLDVTSSYYVSAATETGLAEVRSTTSFDNVDAVFELDDTHKRSEEHTSELQSLMRISYAVFCLKKKQKMKLQGIY